MSTALWTREYPYRTTSVRVERLLHRWRLTLGTMTVEQRTLVDGFEALLHRDAGQDELAVVLAALAFAHAEAPADAALTRELRGLDVEQPNT